MAGNFEVAVKIEGHKYNFLGSHIVIDLAAAQWTTDDLNKLWVDSKMDIAPMAIGLSRDRTTEQDISWLIVGVKLDEPRHWAAKACPAISGVPQDIRRQALSV
jgi:hypothetical protein